MKSEHVVELISRARADDQSAWRDLYDASLPLALGIARRFDSCSPDEFATSILGSALGRAVASWQGAGAFRPYLAVILRREAVKELKARDLVTWKNPKKPSKRPYAVLYPSTSEGWDPLLVGDGVPDSPWADGTPEDEDQILARIDRARARARYEANQDEQGNQILTPEEREAEEAMSDALGILYDEMEQLSAQEEFADLVVYDPLAWLEDQLGEAGPGALPREQAEAVTLYNGLFGAPELGPAEIGRRQGVSRQAADKRRKAGRDRLKKRGEGLPTSW